MHDSVAAIRAGRPRTHFASRGTHRRERHMGLRRSSRLPLPPSMAKRVAAQPLRAIRRAARGLTTVAHAGITASGNSPRSTGLRSTGSVKWSRQSVAGLRRARQRSATPWRD
jgi:hypothetical protein